MNRYYIECINIDGDSHGIIVGGTDVADAQHWAEWVIARVRGWVFVTFGTIRQVE